MTPRAKLFLVIGIVGSLLIVADLVLLLFNPTNLVTYINLFVGLCLTFAGFGSVRALRKQERKRDAQESRSHDRDTSA